MTSKRVTAVAIFAITLIIAAALLINNNINTAAAQWVRYSIPYAIHPFSSQPINPSLYSHGYNYFYPGWLDQWLAPALRGYLPLSPSQGSNPVLPLQPIRPAPIVPTQTPMLPVTTPPALIAPPQPIRPTPVQSPTVTLPPSGQNGANGHDANGEQGHNGGVAGNTQLGADYSGNSNNGNGNGNNGNGNDNIEQHNVINNGNNQRQEQSTTVTCNNGRCIQTTIVCDNGNCVQTIKKH